MCDLSGKLIAYMDGELPDSEAALVEEHLESCAECRSRLAAYQQVSGAFAAYCEAVATAAAVLRPQGRLLRWASATAGAAAAVALLLLLPGRVIQSPAQAERHLTASASAGRSIVSAATAAISATSAAGVHSPSSPVAARAARNPGRAHVTNREHVLIANAVESSTERVPAESAASLPSEPAIQIAIPSDAIFPAGAVPDGVNFVADVTLAADGTAERLRLQPRLVKFERRATRP
jgi:anti-sigma factor RsiW